MVVTGVLEGFVLPLCQQFGMQRESTCNADEGLCVCKTGEQSKPYLTIPKRKMQSTCWMEKSNRGNLGFWNVSEIELSCCKNLTKSVMI